MIDFDKITKDAWQRMSWWDKFKFYVFFDIYEPIMYRWRRVKQYFSNWVAFNDILKEFCPYDYMYMLKVWKKSLELLRDALKAECDTTDNEKEVAAINEAIEILSSFIDEKYDVEYTDDMTREDYMTAISKSMEAKRAAWTRFGEIIRGQDLSMFEGDEYWDHFDGTGIEAWWV